MGSEGRELSLRDFHWSNESTLYLAMPSLTRALILLYSYQPLTSLLVQSHTVKANAVVRLVGVKAVRGEC